MATRPDETRVRRYEEAIYSGDWDMVTGGKTREAIARAVIAVADEEQAELRAEVERLRWLSVIAGSGAEIAEKRLAAVEALAEEWEERNQASSTFRAAARLRAALTAPADAPEA